MRHDEDPAGRKSFPSKSSLSRPMSGPSSLILVALVALIYLAAFASSMVLVGDARHLFPSRVSIPFN
jgi:hypothetical protein